MENNSDTTPTESHDEAATINTDATKKTIINLQYIKDMVVKVPGAPNIYRNLPAKPYASLNIDVNAQQLGENEPNFEVTFTVFCHCFVTSPSEENPTPDKLFQIDLHYAAIVTLGNTIDPSEIETELMVETPRLIFPEARNLLLNITRSAGFPPVIMQEIDFLNFWKERRKKTQQQQEASE